MKVYTEIILEVLNLIFLDDFNSVRRYQDTSTDYNTLYRVFKLHVVLLNILNR